MKSYLKFLSRNKLYTAIEAVGLAVWAARVYLERFAYRVENYGWVFVVAVIISLAIAFVSVIWQTLKAAKTNPAIELKKE